MMSHPRSVKRKCCRIPTGLVYARFASQFTQKLTPQHAALPLARKEQPRPRRGPRLATTPDRARPCPSVLGAAHTTPAATTQVCLSISAHLASNCSILRSQTTQLLVCTWPSVASSMLPGSTSRAIFASSMAPPRVGLVEVAIGTADVLVAVGCFLALLQPLLALHASSLRSPSFLFALSLLLCSLSCSALLSSGLCAIGTAAICGSHVQRSTLHSTARCSRRVGKRFRDSFRAVGGRHPLLHAVDDVVHRRQHLLEYRRIRGRWQLFTRGHRRSRHRVPFHHRMQPGQLGRCSIFVHE